METLSRFECKACGKTHRRLDTLESLVEISDHEQHDLNTRLLAEIAMFLRGLNHELRKVTEPKGAL